MKLSWGVKIAFVYFLFVLCTLVLVFIFMRQDVSLVTNDYYAKEIKYQDQIDKMNRTKELSEQLDILVEPGKVKFIFPKIFRANELSGVIEFYRPANSSRDFNQNIEPDTALVQYVSTQKLEQGLWKIKIDWTAKGNSYFNEKIIMVN